MQAIQPGKIWISHCFYTACGSYQFHRRSCWMQKKICVLRGDFIPQLPAKKFQSLARLRQQSRSHTMRRFARAVSPHFHHQAEVKRPHIFSHRCYCHANLTREVTSQPGPGLLTWKLSQGPYNPLLNRSAASCSPCPSLTSLMSSSRLE